MTDALTWIKSVCRQTDRARRQNTKETLCGGAKTKANLDRRGSAARRQQRNNGKAKLSCSTMRCAAAALPCLCCYPASAAALPLLLSILSSVCSPTLSLLLWQCTTMKMKRKWNNGKLRLTRQKFLSEIICRRDRKVRAGQIHTHTNTHSCVSRSVCVCGSIDCQFYL